MRKLLLIAVVLIVLLAAFLLGREMVKCALIETASPTSHVEWLKESSTKGPVAQSPEREVAMMDVAERKIEQYPGMADPVSYIEWRGWVFVVVYIKPIPQAPFSEYRILAYREVGGIWFLLDEWRWFTETGY